MKREISVKYEFVEFIPDIIQGGKIYISIQYATAVHKCCCGCGLEVVTPLSPTDWSFTFDGQSISLNPSIGNWSFPCMSHYWIKQNKVIWAPKWSKDIIEVGRNHDSLLKNTYYKTPTESLATEISEINDKETTKIFWGKIFFWLKNNIH